VPVIANVQSSTLARFPLEEADRCVLCGLCLPHCPTYRLLQDENESPRGRVSLLRAVATGALPMSDSLAAHLSRCLDCRACERACPSGVRYGRLIEAGRVLTARHRPPGIYARLGLGLVTRPRLLRPIGTLLRLYRRSGRGRVTSPRPSRA
jgi:glycolate oxidase iron-sulfur subunit